MKFIAIVYKSLAEQFRSFWLLVLTVITAPFFVVVYNLISESYKPSYDVVMVNNDSGVSFEPKVALNLGDTLEAYLKGTVKEGFTLHIAENMAEAMRMLISKKADAVIEIPDDFSSRISIQQAEEKILPRIVFTGNLTDMNYIISAIGIYDGISQFFSTYAETEPQFVMDEIALGTSGSLSDFDLAVPGLLVFSIVMLMLSASSAFVAEVENKTIQRLSLSGVSTPEFLGGVSTVQLLVGVISILITLALALAMDFQFEGRWLAFLSVSVLTILSVIAFSLIIAAFTRTVTQVLVVGNFPLFLFMFFTGAMFPVNAPAWFRLGDYSISITGLMSATHAVSAFNELLIMKARLPDVWPQLICLLVTTVVYFLTGLWFFRQRHMRLG
jgi:ABC-type multidrug transport system permease subunit